LSRARLHKTRRSTRVTNRWFRGSSRPSLIDPAPLRLRRALASSAQAAHRRSQPANWDLSVDARPRCLCWLAFALRSHDNHGLRGPSVHGDMGRPWVFGGCADSMRLRTCSRWVSVASKIPLPPTQEENDPSHHRCEEGRGWCFALSLWSGPEMLKPAASSLIGTRRKLRETQGARKSLVPTVPWI